MAPVAGSNVADTAASLAGARAPRAGPSWDLSLSPPAAASESEERDYRRLDANGDAGGAFNLGVLLHQRGDVAGAIAAYERAEQRGDPDAGLQPRCNALRDRRFRRRRGLVATERRPRARTRGGEPRVPVESPRRS